MTTTMGSLDLNAFSDLYNDSNQYFWFESNSSATYGAGVHITLSPDTSFVANPSGQNILMNTDGISIRNGLLPMMTLDNDSLDFNMVDTIGGTYTNIATFGLQTRIGEEVGSPKIIISPESFVVYSKENVSVFKTGVDSGGTVKSDTNINNENTNIIIGSTTIQNGASSSVSGFANLPTLNNIPTNVTFGVRLGTFKRTSTGTSYITITNRVSFVTGTSNTITDSGITISYDGSDTLTVSGTYTNNTGATLILTDNMIRVRGSTATITVPLYDTMINGNAMFNVDGGNTIIGLPLKANSDFDDYDLYNAIVSLGWTSDVMVGISLRFPTYTCNVGDWLSNTTTTIPKRTPISCVSSDPTVAYVRTYTSDGEPLLEARAVGSCTFTYSITVAGKVYTATCNVTVT